MSHKAHKDWLESDAEKKRSHDIQQRLEEIASLETQTNALDKKYFAGTTSEAEGEQRAKLYEEEYRLMDAVVRMLADEMILAAQGEAAEPAWAHSSISMKAHPHGLVYSSIRGNTIVSEVNEVKLLERLAEELAYRAAGTSREYASRDRTKFRERMRNTVAQSK